MDSESEHLRVVQFLEQLSDEVYLDFVEKIQYNLCDSKSARMKDRTKKLFVTAPLLLILYLCSWKRL